MSGAVSGTLSLNAREWIAQIVAAGNVTEAQGQKISRILKYLETDAKAMMAAQKTAANSTPFNNQMAEDLLRQQQAMRAMRSETNRTREAMRQLPAQFTDVFTQLAGGQNPLLILIQQGGQIRDAFGGIGPALRGIASFITPVTVAVGTLAATVGVLGKAFYEGMQRDEAFRKGLIISGNAAGVTASSFERLVDSSARGTRSTMTDAAETLQQLVSSGRIGATTLTEAQSAALLLRKVTGDNADSVAKDFGRMGDGVAKWVAEHNKGMNFVTAAQFKYIQQLEEAGKKEQAQLETYRLLNQRLKTVNENLGYLQTAWQNITEWASRGWNAMLNLGKTETLQQKLNDIRKEIGQITKGGEPARETASFMRLQTLRQQAFLIAEQMKQEGSAAAKVAADAAKNQAEIEKLMEKPKKVEPLGAIRDAREQYKSDFLRSEIASYEELAKAEAKAAEQAIKLQEARDKSFNDWFQKFNENEMAKNMPEGEAIESAVGKYLRDIGDQSKRAEQLVSGSFARMEDAIINFAKTGRLSFRELWAFMAEEYLRNLIRMGEKKFFLDSAGNYTGLLAGLGNIGSWFGGLMGFANGLEYVPYDGYPAILHEGERVQTKMEAQSYRGGRSGADGAIDASVKIGSVGAGVSRGEMLAAINQAAVVQRASIMRSLRQQGAAA